MTSLSDVVLAGLADGRERRLAAIAVLVVALQCAALVAILHGARHFDVAFLRARDARLVQISAEHPVPIGAPIEADPNGAASPLVALLAGWSAPEPGGIWTTSSIDRFAISLPANHPANLSLTLTGTVFAPIGGPQEITLQQDGIPVGHWRLHGGPAQLTAALRPPPGGTLYLTLLIAHPARPPGLDPRRLGFHLASVLVTPERP